MKGETLGFDPDTSTGAISEHDGSRYEFARLDWRGPAQPTRGIVVDFVPEGVRATQIFPLAAPYNPGEGQSVNVVFTFIWWIVRCVKGLKLLAQGAAHEKPATWLW